MGHSEAIKLIEKKVKEGKGKQEILREVKKEIKIPRKDLANILQHIPTLAQRVKYKGLNTVLIVFLFVSIVVKSFKAWLVLEGTEDIHFFVLTLALPIIYLFITIEVAKFKAFTYKPLVIFSFLDILDFIIIFLFMNFPDFFASILTVSIVNLVVAVVLLFLGMALDKRMNSSYTRKYEKYTAKDGKKKTRILYIMDEEYSSPTKK